MKQPICPRITHNATERSSVVFPPIFGPVMMQERIPCWPTRKARNKRKTIHVERVGDERLALLLLHHHVFHDEMANVGERKRGGYEREREGKAEQALTVGRT